MDFNVTLNNGVKMPFLGLGTFHLQSPDVLSITEEALKLGYRLIDTAAVYKNEVFIGEVIKKIKQYNIPREDIFITSKLGPANQGTDKAKLAALNSLKNLELEYLDLYLIHWPASAGMKPEDPKNAQMRKESWLEMEKLYKEGKFKAIGISNYTIEHIKELLQYCTVVPAVLQVEVHPYLNQLQLREFCKDQEIHIQAYSSLGSREGCQELMANQFVMDIGQEQNKTSAQVLLRWAIQHGLSVIPKTTNLEHLKENIDIFDFSLTNEQMYKLDSLDRQKHYCWNPDKVL